jgi:hypothetical protein
MMSHGDATVKLVDQLVGEEALEVPGASPQGALGRGLAVIRKSWYASHASSELAPNLALARASPGGRVKSPGLLARVAHSRRGGWHHGDGAMKQAGREHWVQKRCVKGEDVTAVPAALDLMPPGRLV